MTAKNCYLATVECFGTTQIKVGISGNVDRRLRQLLGPAQLVAVTAGGDVDRERFVMDAVRQVDCIAPQSNRANIGFCRGGRRNGEYFTLTDETMSVALEAMTAEMPDERPIGCCPFCDVTETADCDRVHCSQCGLEVLYPFWEPSPVSVHAGRIRRRNYQYPLIRVCCDQPMNLDDRGFAYPMPAAHIAQRIEQDTAA